MKENIEDIIKQLQTILKIRKEQEEIIECAGGFCVNCKPDIDALEHSIKILSDYKKVVEENKELRIVKNLIQTLELNQVPSDKYILITKQEFLYGNYKKLLDEYIPKQKIKDKIEEFKINLKEYKNYVLSKEETDVEYIDFVIGEQIIRVLQELLKEE